MSEYQLTTEIMKLSRSKHWDQAKLEWTLQDIFESETLATCLCSHFPIKELCVLNNKHNGNQATVGNCCVKKFIGLPSDKIFQAVKRVRKNSTKSLNAEAVQHAFNKRWINAWEKEFYFDVMRKRKLTPKQSEKKQQINDLVLVRMRR